MSSSNNLYIEGLKRMQKNRGAMISAYIILFMSFVAIFADALAPFPFYEQDVDNMFQSFGWPHVLGTDGLGRDMFSRIIHGAQVSMAVGFFTSLTSLVIGTVYGAASGWFGGWIDSVMMRVVDIILAIPTLVLLILVMVIFDSFTIIENQKYNAIAGIFFALSFVGWVGIARIVRGQVLQTKEMVYVEAAKSLGVSSSHIVFKHILPNILGPIIVTLTFQIPANILFESFLSFIGLGLQPPYSSWGVLANDGWRAIRTYPHLIITPGIALYLTIMSFNLLGDGLRDAFDPKLK
tara:strand:- start:1040 stop:1918 length:879 start_codon:yes stop_codon:yes gene_type:complete